MRIPEFNDPEVTKFLVEQDRELDKTKKDTLSSVTGNRSLLLYSPSKLVYEVTVTDLGVLVVTQVSA